MDTEEKKTIVCFEDYFKAALVSTSPEKFCYAILCYAFTGEKPPFTSDLDQAKH